MTVKGNYFFKNTCCYDSAASKKFAINPVNALQLQNFVKDKIGYNSFINN